MQEEYLALLNLRAIAVTIRKNFGISNRLTSA
jgi:hypothetical protein